MPIALAVLFSFNNGQVAERLAGLLLAVVLSPTRCNSVLHDPPLHAAVVQTLRLSLYTTLIAVPLGVAFALGINRWRGCTSSSFNFVMILSFVIPELIFGVAMFFVFTALFTVVQPRHAGRGARPGHLERQLAGDHRAGPAGHDRASSTRRRPPTSARTQLQTMRRVMLPLLAPAIFASAVLVFSGVIDDFVHRRPAELQRRQHRRCR